MRRRRRIRPKDVEDAKLCDFSTTDSPVVGIQRMAAEIGRLKRRMLRLERRLGPPRKATR